jgi:competence protein ComGC
MSEENKTSRLEFTVLAVLLVVLFIGFIVCLAIPNFNPGSHTSSHNACINNLRQIDGAAYEFALEHHLTNGEAINFPTDLTPYIKLNSAGKIPSCPMGGFYSIKKVGDVPTCSLGSTVTPPHILQ